MCTPSTLMRAWCHHVDPVDASLSPSNDVPLPGNMGFFLTPWLADAFFAKWRAPNRPCEPHATDASQSQRVTARAIPPRSGTNSTSAL